MIEIKITSLDSCDKPMLSALAEMFAKLAGSPLNDRVVASGFAIAQDDNPAAGSPTVSDAAQTFAPVEVVNPADAFAPTVTTNDAAQAFGTPNPADKFDTNLANFPNVPPVSVPGADVLVPVQSTSPVLLDADNLPWDARIHSSARSQNADGRWKKKKNVDPALVAAVTNELRGVMALPAGAPTPATAAPVGVTTPTTPPAPPATAAPVGPFPALLMKITAAGLDLNRVSAILAPMGIASLPVLAARPDLIPAVDAEINKLIAS